MGYSSPVSDAANTESVRNIEQYSSPPSDKAVGRTDSNHSGRNHQDSRSSESNSPTEADDEYSSPNNRYNAIPQRRNRNKPGSFSQGNGFPLQSIDGCPAGSIEECVKVCPGTPLRVYGACVNSCAERC